MTARALVLLAAGALAAGGAAWSAREGGTSSPAGAAPVDAPASGEMLFHAKGCASCHDGPTSTSAFGVGPSLRDAPTWAGSRVEGLSAEEYVAQSIRDPDAAVSPSASTDARMPTLAMGPGEVDALVAYLLAD